MMHRIDGMLVEAHRICLAPRPNHAIFPNRGAV